MRAVARPARIRLLAVFLLCTPLLAGCIFPAPYKCHSERKALGLRIDSVGNVVETLVFKTSYLDSFALLGPDGGSGTTATSLSSAFYLEGKDKRCVEVKALNALKPDYDTILFRWDLKPIADTNLWVAIKCSYAGNEGEVRHNYIDTFLFDAETAFGHKRLDSYHHLNTGRYPGKLCTNYLLEDGNRHLIYRGLNGCVSYNLLDGSNTPMAEPPNTEHPLFP